MNNFDDIFLFSKVAQLGSYTKAAKMLNTPKATISRRIRSLEERLGVKLMNRNSRNLSLTEAGSYLFHSSHSQFNNLSDIEKEVANFQTKPAGDLRVTIPLDIGVRLLNDIISDFLVLHPQINLDLHLTNELVDIIDEGFDVAIRGGRPKDSNLISKQIMSSKLHFCCSPAYIEKNNLPEHPLDLNHYQLLAYPYPSYQHMKLTKGKEEISLHIKSNISANSLDMILKCALKGLGIGILPSSVCFDAIKKGELITLCNDWVAPDVALYALYPDRVKTKKLVLFIEFLQTKLQYLENEFIKI